MMMLLSGKYTAAVRLGALSFVPLRFFYTPMTTCQACVKVPNR